MSKETYVQPSAARKAELEARMEKLAAEIEDTTDGIAKLKLIIKYKKLEDEYNLYYND